MPKRTNDFQSLIALIERQLSASGSTVVESELLLDRLTGERREIDVCIRAQVNGKPVTLALECRDHRRKADQIWVDGLIGKYRNLAVDKIFAVARAGFTKPAAVAAEKAGIQTLSLDQATAANWHLIAELPNEALVVAHFPSVASITLHLVKGQEPIDTPLVSSVMLRHGDRSVPLASILERYCTSEEVMHRAFSDDTLTSFPARIEVPEGTLIELPGGPSRLLAAIELEIAIARDKSDTAFERKVYGQAGVAYASKLYVGAQVMFSMLQQDGETSIGASIRTPDGKRGSIVSMKAEWPSGKKR